MEDIQAILEKAMRAGASDIHITVGTPPKMRVNGKLEAMSDESPVPDDTRAILNVLSTETLREKFEKRGDYEFSYSDPHMGRFRVNAYKQRGSVSLAIRLVGDRIPTPDEIKLPDQIMNLARKPSGLVIATGAAGSGKSTTLAILIDTINHSRNVHVITLEEPIEFLHKHDMAIVDQREIGMDSRNYEESIRSAIRSDPDVIMIEDMADPLVTHMAIAAAESGKLVLTTVSAPSVQAAIEKLIDTFPPKEQSPTRTQLARVLDTVFCQQLVPAQDGSRTAAFEILNARFQEVRACIRGDDLAQLTRIIAENPRANMLAMDDNLIELVRTGAITQATAMRFARDTGYISGHT